MNVVTPAPGPNRSTQPARWQRHLRAKLARQMALPYAWRPKLGGCRKVITVAPTPHRRPLGVLLIAATLLLANTTLLRAEGWPWSAPLTPPQQPHPAVVRVNVDEAEGTAHGSGTLVQVRDRFGIVITNWHVVRDATGSINVVFPDGFRSAARVLRVDRDWDLAALLIWRPPTSPINIAPQAPRPGEVLTIAGYGSGNYRAVTGRCTQYVSPSDHHPFEMVEVAASARQGDSGGPILNTTGELAGVLFGSGGGTTSGAYAGRVHQFLSTAWPPGEEADFTNTIAAAPNQPQTRPPLQQLPAYDQDATQPVPDDAARASIAQMSRLPATTSDFMPASKSTPAPIGETLQQPELASADLPQTQATTFTWQDFAGNSPLQQGKTFLAILGLFTLLAQVSRLLTPREA